MDCVDCHNRATHIYQDPETAIDEALAAGRIDRSLPFAKKMALAALLGNWADKEAALRGIENAVRGNYLRMARRAARACCAPPTGWSRSCRPSTRATSFRT